MDKKSFIKTYKFVCTECGEFWDIFREYCEKCGSKDSVRKATKDDYKKREENSLKAQESLRNELRDKDEYIKIVENYKMGNYKYATIQSEKDIIDAYKKNRILVFVNKRFGRQFFVLDTKGLIFKKKVGDVELYSWKELIVKVYQVKATSKFLFGLINTELADMIEIKITLPESSEYKFFPMDYDLKEFPSVDDFVKDIDKKLNLDGKHNNELLLECKKYTRLLMARSFDRYYYFGKYGIKDS